MASKSRKTSLTTKTGKTLLGPLNLKQSTDLMDKTSRPKEKSKIQNRIKLFIKNQKNPKKETVVEVAE
jgi:hypothetical protein